MFTNCELRKRPASRQLFGAAPRSSVLTAWLREHDVGHARPAIPNSNDRVITFAANRHVDGSSLAGEANGIANDILNGAAEQFFDAGDRAFFEGCHVDSPRLRACFEVRIGDHFVYQSGQVNG